jgi:fructose-1-phosphate kinase PfkB-like protein
MNRKELTLLSRQEVLTIPSSVVGRDIFECLKQLGIDIKSEIKGVTAEPSLRTAESSFAQMRIDQQISSTKQTLQMVLNPDFLSRERPAENTISMKKSDFEMACIVGPISLDLNLIFRNVGGVLKLEEADLMPGGTGLKAIAAARYGMRSKFITMAQDPLMRDIFDRWSEPIGSTSDLAIGPSRIVPHISIVQEGMKNPEYPAILVPRISLQLSEGDAFLEHVKASLPDTKENHPIFLCLNGRHTFPGLPPSYYTDLMKTVEQKGYRVVADMRLGMSEQEMQAIYEGSPWMVKPNLDEFLKFYRHLYPEISVPSRPTNDEIGRMAADVTRRFCINVLAITLGKDGAVLVIRRPKLKGVLAGAVHAQEVSPIGCGDAFTGTFLAQLIEQGDYNIALRYAVAAGTETAKMVGTQIANRENTDQNAVLLQELELSEDLDCLDEKSYVCEKLFHDRGYLLNSSTERGGSSMQTFFAQRRTDGLDCVIKYSDWDGVSSDGIPWLLGQAIKLKSMETDVNVPQELKDLYPKVFEIYQGENVAYYAMEQFKGAQDLARFYLDSPDIGAQQMFDELSNVFKRLLRAYVTKNPEPRECEIEQNLLGRAEKRLDMLANKSDSQVYRRLVEGKPFALDNLQFKDAGHFFDRLMKAETVAINGILYQNLPQLLSIIRKNLPKIQDQIGPTHFSNLTHGDLSIRNFLKCGNGDIKIIDVRSPTRIHSVTPVSTSIEYDFAKLFYSPMMELVRNEFCQVNADENWQANAPAFQLHFRSHPTVDRFAILRQMLHQDFVDDEMRELLQIKKPEWNSYPLFGEALNYASDAVHRLSQDPSGKHSLIYYLEAVRQLTEILCNQGFIATSTTQL